mgnify:CR=1 FL=1
MPETVFNFSAPSKVNARMYKVSLVSFLKPAPSVELRSFKIPSKSRGVFASSVTSY